MEISSKSITQSTIRLSTKNAWAKYVRNRWPQNTLSAVQIEWDLTEGEARGVLYAQASQPTIDKMLDHPTNGGFWLGLHILEIRMGTPLEVALAANAESARHERQQAEAKVRRAERLEEASRAVRAERGRSYG